MTAGDDPSGCVAVVVRCPPVGELESEWRELEARADPPVFLSWVWIGTQIAAFGLPDFLARVTREGETVGLALLGYRRANWLRRPSLHLNETGDPLRDSVMTEYNGVLASGGGESEAALIGALRAPGAPSWRELHLSGVPESWAERCRAQGLVVRLLRSPQPAPFMEFGDLAPADPLDALSSNSRQRLRRSLRWFERRGPLTLGRAADAAEAAQWLAGLEDLHGASWRTRNKPGAFANPRFGSFHRTLIERSFAEGVPDLLRIRAGVETIGYLYNFLWHGWAYAYQSGLRYEDDPDCRPGLVAHLLAMRRYRDLGMTGYRFLAGDSRYKSSFATGKDLLLWMTVRRPGWGDHLGQIIHRRWRAWRGVPR
jgi:CelD/BcsL family acetyltransferase involved in cellulose biosynthesis